ncbi:MAG: hypothetical protein ACPGVB_05620 [Chitinophagales bacterium]
MKTKTIFELLQAHTTAKVLSKESLNSLKGGNRGGRGRGRSNPSNNDDDDNCSYHIPPPVIYTITDG